MIYTTSIVYRPSFLNKLLGSLTRFSKPPKFKAPKVGLIEWMAIYSGAQTYIVLSDYFFNLFAFWFWFWLIFFHTFNTLACSMYGFEYGRNTKQKFKKVAFKFIILYLVGSFLAGFFYTGTICIAKTFFLGHLLVL